MEDLLVPVLRGLESREQQLRIDSFVAFRERFAKIKSKRLRKAVAGITGSENPAIALGLEDEAVKDKDAGRRSAEPAIGSSDLHMKRTKQEVCTRPQTLETSGITADAEDDEYFSRHNHSNPVNRRTDLPRKAKRKRSYAEQDL